MPRVSAIQPTDEELLARVADGDRDAFGDLYQRYARAVLGLAIRRLGDRGRAEDAVQEAFASVWRAARSYKRDRGPVAPWLYAVARNAIADRGRARTEPPAEPLDSPSDEPGPPEQAEQSWVAYRVHRAMEELPGDGANRARARVLERAVAERDLRLPGHPARYREDAHTERPAAALGGAGGGAG